MNAVLELEALGFEFTFGDNKWRAVHTGTRREPERVRALKEYLQHHRDEAVRFLQQRAMQQVCPQDSSLGEVGLDGDSSTETLRQEQTASAIHRSQMLMAEAAKRWPNDPPPTEPCRPFGIGEHRSFWRRPTGGWVCEVCHPCPRPAGSVQTWELLE